MLGDQYGFIESDFQLAVAVTLLLVVLETARRGVGWPLPLVAGLALLYGLFGQYIPGEFGHSGTPVESFFGTLTIAEGGIWGTLTGASVSVVAIFVIFGAVLNAGEAGQGFMNVAAAAAGRLKGGAAKVLVLSSALFGSISGSASANVASTGAITLPAMTKLGYPAPCRRGRGRSLLRRADHATPDGCRCLCHGRAYRRALHRYYGRRSPASAAVFRRGLDGHQHLCQARTG